MKVEIWWILRDCKKIKSHFYNILNFEYTRRKVNSWIYFEYTRRKSWFLMYFEYNRNILLIYKSNDKNNKKKNISQ